jgi:hypothetical protein
VVQAENSDNWANMVAAKCTIPRDDLELRRLLDENGIWTIYGQKYQILGAAITLLRALARGKVPPTGSGGGGNFAAIPNAHLHIFGANRQTESLM